MAIFTKAIIAGIAGTVAVGAMVTWDGGTTVDSAKNKITEAATQIGVFKQNETALVSKVNTLKTEKATLTAEVAALKVELQVEKDKGVADKARIVELEAEIAAKNAQIAELETEIATLTNDLSDAAGNTAEITERIDALEAELNAANEQAEELQYTLDTTVLAEPDQVAVDAALSDGEAIVPDPPVEPEPTPEPDPTPVVNPINMVAGTPVTLANELVMDKEELKDTAGNLIGYQLRVTNNNVVDSYDLTVNGQSYTVATNSNVLIGMATDLDGKVLTVDNAFMTLKTFTLINK
jgi:uncharacterized coiled-coil protein SlyX